MAPGIFFLDPAAAPALAAASEFFCKYIYKKLVTLVYIVASLFFTLEKISKEVMYHTICVNYEAKI